MLEEGHQRTIRWCAWSPDARFVASCSFDGTAAVWESLDGEFDCVAQLEGHENEVKAVAWSPSGGMLATCGRDKSVFVWEVADENFEVAGVLHSHGGDVKCVKWHPQREVLASASYDNTLKLYVQGDGGEEWRCAGTLAAHASTVWALAFSPDGASLASCSDDKSVVLWRDTTGDGLGFVPASSLREVHERTIYTLDWATDGSNVIATGGGDDAIALMRARVGEPGMPLAGGSLEALGVTSGAHGGDVNAVAWQPGGGGGGAGGSLLASCGDDGCLRLWRVAT